MSTQFALDLRLARRKAGYTQADVAHLLSGHQSLVSDLELGLKRPNLEQIIELSLLYGKSFESFFGELLAERQRVLHKRLGRLPKVIKPSAHTFNRTRSLERLRKRLKSQIEYGGA
ncbi:helix-turn-helix protein [Litoreibacter meonggei]|uniref:Helix-turn-helix protein n=1 Tax=Litoreibacter meonggei TaxID=1049199 RepID=A0A497VBP8_9RHOB|nr:helix-turn-helix transcriptional regulator [Litoreibacter meonggei]RLJ40692.1 helix-turn-helix protein [Litoreibacter meonggei]